MYAKCETRASSWVSRLTIVEEFELIRHTVVKVADFLFGTTNASLTLTICFTASHHSPPAAVHLLCCLAALGCLRRRSRCAALALCVVRCVRAGGRGAAGSGRSVMMLLWLVDDSCAAKKGRVGTDFWFVGNACSF